MLGNDGILVSKIDGTEVCCSELCTFQVGALRVSVVDGSDIAGTEVQLLGRRSGESSMQRMLRQQLLE